MRPRWLVGVVLVVVAILALAAVAYAAKRNFVAPLSGAQEVSPVETLAKGQAVFQLSKDGSELQYKLTVASIEGVIASHIHFAPAGVNGPVVAFLYAGPTIPGRSDGVLAEGSITGANLVGPLAGQPLSALLALIRTSNTYVNVHTTAHPGGEIRGQIR